MKLKLVFLLLGIAVTFVFASAKAAGPARPKLSMASFEHSFGKVKAGTPLTHTFKIKNEGKASLEIKSVSPACGCTASSYDKKIAPGQSGGITLAIEHTESYRGEVVKTAEVTSNDPDLPRFTLTLRAVFTEK
jgi:Protein of unknown function (DUF1573)